MIRAAEPADIAGVEKLVENFWPSTGSGFDYKEGSVIPFLELSLSHGLLVVAEVDGKLVGAAGGLLSPLMGNDEIVVGAELAWWVEPEYRKSSIGIELLRDLEQRAKDRGCATFSVTFMETSMPEVVRKIYINEGYSLAETTYTKRL